jgi:glutamine amidotransferase
MSAPLSVVVVDIGLGNLRSVQKALDAAAELGGKSVRVVRSSDPDAVRRADHVVMPGQGGFGEFARGLRGGLDEALVERIRAGTSYLGICLGLQLLLERSEEDPDVAGLGVIPGSVVHLRAAPGLKIPHMGWNQLELVNGGDPHLEAAGGAGTFVYFVHSYHAEPSDPSVLRAIAEYGPNRVTASIARDNVFATQFHPEKSQAAGLRLLAAFLRR